MAVWLQVEERNWSQQLLRKDLVSNYLISSLCTNMTIDFIFIVDLIAVGCFALIVGVQIAFWNKGISSSVLLFASVVTLIWCLTLLFQGQFTITNYFFIPLVEIFRNLSWYFLFLSFLGIRQVFFKRFEKTESAQILKSLAIISFGVPFALGLYVLYLRFLTGEFLLLPLYGGTGVIIGFLLSAIVGLALLEQTLRNAREHHTWQIKFLCLGLGIIFSYEIYLYSNALLFEQIDTTLWRIRSVIMILATPFVVIGVFRTRKEPLQINISRQLVFHTGVLIVAGAYLLLMATAGYYVRNFSSEWGGYFQVLFWAISLSFLAVLLYSGRVRSFIKLYINRHLFSSKYDYREEWMKISSKLSQKNPDETLQERAIYVMADLVDSPGGTLWVTSDDSHYDQVAHVEMGWIENSALSDDDYLIRYLKSSSNIINLKDPAPGLDLKQLPDWVFAVNNPWLIVPLHLEDHLVGFVLLKESRVNFELIWEDFDLLKVAGQQTASYLAQTIAADKLSEARQFSAFNQVSAFVVHDIKTLMSQLSMLVKNAEKHKTNPSFIEDLILTTKHAVDKMDWLLEHFKKQDSLHDNWEVVNFVELLDAVVLEQSKLKPVPRLVSDEEKLMLSANAAELKSAITHIVQNAQEATDEEGQVELVVNKDANNVVLNIKDSGKGMTRDFIYTRLFKPFESTKGLTGMGLGVYQSRATIRKFHGDMQVSSEPGVGSQFLITLPIALES